MKIKLTKEIKDICNTFAYDSVATSQNHYSHRNQFNPYVIRHQIYIGKLGEFATYEYLKNYFPDIAKPDTNIYDKTQKSFDTDLKSGDFKFHIKSQSQKSAEQYGLSWTFQAGSKNTKKSHIDKEVFEGSTVFQFVSFVMIDEFDDVADIKGIIPLEILHSKKLFKDPKLEKLKGIKLVVYYDDLKDYNDYYVFHKQDEEQEFRI